MLIIALSAFGCKSKPHQPLLPKVKSVLILGNSITIHPPAPGIGWNNNWGMAASVKDSDYVHLLEKRIHQVDAGVSITIKNLAGFEANYNTFNVLQLDSLRYPDLVILRISENVQNIENEMPAFISCVDKMLKYIHPKNIVITDGFWTRGFVNKSLENYAVKNSYSFVRLSDLDHDENKALGQFKNHSVAIHPSDAGMRKIAARIWTAIKIYF